MSLRPASLPRVAEDVVPADHPCLAGHFPGRPILPAVLLLEKAAAAVAALEPDLCVTGVSEAKFVRPGLPDQPLAIHLGALRAGRVAFEIRTGTAMLAYRRLTAEPRSESACP